MKKLLLIIILLPILAIAALFLIDSAWLGKTAAEKMVDFAKTEGLGLQIENPRARFLGFATDKITITPLRVPLVFEIQESRSSISVIDLITGSVVASTRGFLYDGEFSGSIQAPRTFESGTGSMRVERVNIPKLPFMTALGIAAGFFSLDISQIKFDRAGHNSAEIALRVLDLSKPHPTSVPGFMNSHLPNLPIPAFTVKNFDGLLVVDGALAELKRFTASSSLGEASGTARIELPTYNRSASSTSRIRALFSINLTREGVSGLGPWLPHMTDGRLPATADKFTIEVSGSLANPALQFSQIY